MQHWLTHTQVDADADEVVALLDPDMIFLRPLQVFEYVNDLGSSRDYSYSSLYLYTVDECVTIDSQITKLA